MARPVKEIIEAGRVEHADGCHSYKGRTWGNQPSVGFRGRRLLISRVLLGIEDQAWLRACHTCDHNWCINNAHLRARTQRDNIREMISRGRGWWQRSEA